MTDTNQASEDKLREAVRDGLANHTGEFVNPWIFRKNYSHEELTDMLDDIMASERLFKNLQALITTQKQEAYRQGYNDNARNCYCDSPGATEGVE